VANSMFNQTVMEMPKEYMRWGDPNNISGQMTSFIGNHQTLLSEYAVRTDEVRNDIVNNFSLNGLVDVTLDVMPVGAGKINISTIVPDSLPWTGVYFNGNPVRITALPNPGYTFSHWDITAGASTVVDTSTSIENNISWNTLFKAHFNGGPSTVSYLNGGVDGLQVYPNPSSGVFYIRLNSEAPSVTSTRLRVFDFTGAEVFAQDGIDLKGMYKVDLSYLPKGVYLLQLTSGDNKSYSKKVLVSGAL